MVAVLPASHRLAARKAVRVQDFAKETYITPTRVAPRVRGDAAAVSGRVVVADCAA